MPTVETSLLVEVSAVEGGTEVAAVVISKVDDSTVVLSLLVTLFEVANDAGSTVVVTSGVVDFNVVENSVVCSVLGTDVCFCVVVMPGVEI